MREGERREAGTDLCVSDMNQARFILLDLIAVSLTFFETFWKCEPLTYHFVSIIGIDKLVVIDAIACKSFHSLDCGMALVDGEDVVDRV